VGYEINWSVSAGDPILTHPLYLKYSSTAIGAIVPEVVKQDLAQCLASREAAAVAAYLAWLLRMTSLVA
jgi:hypothetical protein